MSDVAYAAAIGIATGVWAVIAAYWIAEAVATWRKRRADRVRRFFVEAGNSTRLGELRLAAGEVEPFDWRVGDVIYGWGVKRDGEYIPFPGGSR